MHMGFGHLGPRSHLGFSPLSSKTKNNPFSSQHSLSLHEMEETLHPPTVMALSPVGITSLLEHLENVTNDPREKSFTLYVSP